MIGPATVISVVLALGCAAAGDATRPVALYGVFERHVTKPKRHSNPFDFRVVELRTRFTAPSGRTVSFFGFHDGDGKGGQTGQVWAFRFMPDEVGRWRTPGRGPTAPKVDRQSSRWLIRGCPAR